MGRLGYRKVKKLGHKYCATALKAVGHMIGKGSLYTESKTISLLVANLMQQRSVQLTSGGLLAVKVQFGS